MMTRIDYWNNPHAPTANSLVPAASAVVTDNEGKILLHRRSDNDLWALPGGAMEIGESISETVVREVKEETGLDVVIERLVGIYTNPKHVVAFSDGEVRQEFSICFACRAVGGTLTISDESFEASFFAPEAISRLAMHESIRLRIKHFLEHSPQPAVD
jgi:ADP-ribose pyrophosphatase YjhB (NUDIX family)